MFTKGYTFTYSGVTLSNNGKLNTYIAIRIPLMDTLMPIMVNLEFI